MKKKKIIWAQRMKARSKWTCLEVYFVEPARLGLAWLGFFKLNLVQRVESIFLFIKKLIIFKEIIWLLKKEYNLRSKKSGFKIKSILILKMWHLGKNLVVSGLHHWPKGFMLVQQLAMFALRTLPYISIQITLTS